MHDFSSFGYTKNPFGKQWNISLSKDLSMPSKGGLYVAETKWSLPQSLQDSKYNTLFLTQF